MDKHTAILAREFSRREEHVENVIRLLDEGNTIPFIARYRKEMHGTMDDQMLRSLADRLDYLRKLDARRDEVRAALEGMEKLTDDLSQALEGALTLAEVEDIYRPYRPKRRTRATMAKEKGLEPLAELLYAQKETRGTLEVLAEPYVNREKGVASVEEALAGASDIIAERISDDTAVRGALKRLIRQRGELRSTAAKEEDSVYRQYYDYAEALFRVQGYRVLALNRG